MSFLTPFQERGYYGMEGEQTMVTAASETDYRLELIRRKGHLPHEFTPALEKRWGIRVCAVCGKANLYFAHDGDIRNLQ